MLHPNRSKYGAASALSKMAAPVPSGRWLRQAMLDAPCVFWPAVCGPRAWRSLRLLTAVCGLLNWRGLRLPVADCDSVRTQCSALSAPVYVAACDSSTGTGIAPGNSLAGRQAVLQRKLPLQSP